MMAKSQPDEEGYDPGGPSPSRLLRSHAGCAPMTASSSEELREAIAREEARVARLDSERRLSQIRLDALRGELAARGIPSIRPTASLDLRVHPTRDLGREGHPVPPTLPGAGRPLSEALDEQHHGSQGIRAGLRQRVGARRLREAARQVRRVPQPGVPCRDRSGHPGSPPRAPRRGCLPTPHGRDLLARGGRLRQALLGGRRARVHGDVPDDRGVERRRAVAVGARRPRLVLLRGTSSGHRRAEMACYLLTETMSHHHQLGIESYDRLFPNQDTLFRGASAT